MVYFLGLMDSIFKSSILYDLYGGILPKNQKTVYEYHVVDDLSFTEIGEELGITRQAAYDLYKNADKKLIEIDNKLLLSKRLKSIENNAKKIVNLCEKIDDKNKDLIINLSNKIINETIKGGNI